MLRFHDFCTVAHLALYSLAPGRCDRNSELVILKLITMIDIFSISSEIILRWIPRDLRSMQQNTSDEKSTQVEVMAWCSQATSHYLDQRSHRSMSPYDVTRPQLVNVSSGIPGWCKMFKRSSSNCVKCFILRLLGTRLWLFLFQLSYINRFVLHNCRLWYIVSLFLDFSLREKSYLQK